MTHIPLPDNIDEFLDMLSPHSLKILHRKIQDRLSVHARPSHSFNLGDQVTFVHKGTTYFATIIRINPKTISVVENSLDRRQWNVSPSLLSPLRSASA